MAAPAHELLKIEALRLKTANDKFIQDQYDAAVAEARKKGAPISQLLALESAFEALNTEIKRQDYIKKLPVAPEKTAKLYVANPKDESAIKEAYLLFVRDNYKGTDLEKSKPEEHTFNDENEFKKSSLYKNIPAETRDSISKFPCKIICLKFANHEDTQRFIKDLAEKQGINLQAAPPTLSSARGMKP